MRVLLFGASGMVGQGVLRECLRDPGVESVVSVGRTRLGLQHPKFREIVHADLLHLGPLEDRLSGFDAAFYCLGVSVLGKSEAEYRQVTYDLTLAVGETLARRNPSLTFVYVSGSGTDSSEKGPRMWARVKGQTENALLRLPFRAAFMFRPGAIQPLHGVRSKTPAYRVIYLVLRPFLPLLLRLAPNGVTTTEKVGRAMLRVAKDGGPGPIVDTREINRLAALSG
jgi:uncharacterized protein YbjT (DUF2867 family)